MTTELPLGSMQDVMNVVVLSNPELKRELEETLFLLIRDMKDVIRSGYRPHILPLQKTILPGLLRSLMNGQHATQDSAERAVFERFIQYMGGTAVIEMGIPRDTGS